MKCWNCGSENPELAKFCNTCGEKPKPQGKTCPNKDCNRSGLTEDALFCPDCGCAISPSEKISKANTGSKLRWGIIITGFIVLLFTIFIVSFINQYYFSDKPDHENSSPIPDINNSATTENNSNKSFPGKYPYASTRYLTSDDLNNLSSFELKIMRNEIYARHGFIFQTKAMQQYFQNQSWYRNISKLNNNDEVYDYLTRIEKANINLIKSYE